MAEKYLILSDIHGNVSAFDAVLADCAGENFAGIILLGDDIDYGMRSNEIIRKMIALKENEWKDSRLFKEMFNTLANKKIAMFGFAFKADTGDTRETPAGNVARLLHAEHVRLTISDPKAIENGKRDLADLDGIVWEKNPYKAAKDADAVLLMTDWKEYPELDWEKIYKSMRKPALVFDTRNCLDAYALRKLGFKVLNIGK